MFRFSFSYTKSQIHNIINIENLGGGFMVRLLIQGLLSGALFVVIILLKDVLGMEVFFMAAVSMALFSVIEERGNYFKEGLALLIGVGVAFLGVIFLATKMPLPPNNLVPLLLVCGLSILILVLISGTSLKANSLLLGWASYYASVWPIYTKDVTALSSAALPNVVGVSAALLLGLVMALIIKTIDVKLLLTGKE